MSASLRAHDRHMLGYLAASCSPAPYSRLHCCPSRPPATAPPPLPPWNFLDIIPTLTMCVPHPLSLINPHPHIGPCSPLNLPVQFPVTRRGEGQARSVGGCGGLL
eukprot:748550-Hanusia_phi.AAC.2